MKIRKLSMLGFKSFMDRLEITFPLGISGVVGPNGCGKSNIVDAIRWCMGEQSPKQLRGRRMEDVIFNGTGNMKPLGMAEVSLLFENGNGLFPPAFAHDTEMSVTRRLFRSGESEYRINNVPCRLKDIQEIFMDTGLGNKAYSIIGQGKIGNILEQKPEDTRIMLEEAAGITKYRRKVEASQKKIGLTETNLQRVEDILGEVQKQMRSLKRQASKARRYKAICEKVQNLEIMLYANTYNQYNEESGDKLKSTEDFIRQEVTVSTRLSQLHVKIEQMNLELEEKDNALSDLRKNYLYSRERVHKKEAGLEALTGEMRMLEEMKGRLTGEQGEIKNRLTGIEQEKAGLQEELARVKGRFRELESEIALEEKRLNARRQSLKRIKEDYETARAELSSGKNREVGLSHESGYLNKMLSGITDSRSRLESELKDVKTRMKKIIDASERKSIAREAVAERLLETEGSIEEQGKDRKDLEQTKKHVEMELKSAEADLNAFQSRLVSLQALIENFEGYKMGVRTIMKAKDLEPHQQGHILGLVADVINVDPQYEEAVEAVLADKLQYIIVESQEDGKQAVDYLRKKERGRSSFVPLKDLNGNGKDQANDSRFPFLSDLVSAQGTYGPLVKALLGDAALVKDLDTAMSAWKNIADTGGRNAGDLSFVTIEGDMVDQRGVITGGKLAQSSRGLLARKRQVVEFEANVVSKGKEVDGLKFKLEEITAEIQEKEEAIEGLMEEKWTCQEEINEFDKMIFRFGQELDQLEKLSQRVSKDLETKAREQNKHKKELIRIEEELRNCKAQRQEEEAYFRKKEIELEESEEEFDQFRDELTGRKADYRILEEEQRSLARDRERLEEYTNDSLKRLQKIEEDISSGYRRHDECQRRKEALKEDLAGLYEKLEKAEEGVNSADRERQEWQNEIKEKQKDAESVQAEIEVLKEKISAAKMERSEIHFKMNSLVEMTREKFNMDLRDIYEQSLDEGFSHVEVEEKIEREKRSRQALGEVNLTAIKEHDALKERYEFIKNQREDLVSSIESLRIAIAKINRTSVEKFRKAFQDVGEKLKVVFPILFNGGTAGLKLTDETRPLESGVLVEVKLPGKRVSHMGLLSGGEKALVAMALLFAIYMIKPSPFCLLDEVDAPLDEANIDRFNNLLKEIQRFSQIIMVTHNRRTMEIADRLYGITMEKAGVSSVVSVEIQGVNNQVYEDASSAHAVSH